MIIDVICGWGRFCHPVRGGSVVGGPVPPALSPLFCLCSPPLQVRGPAGELRPVPQGRPEVRVRLVQRRAQVHPPPALCQPLQPLARLVQPQRQVLQPADHRGEAPEFRAEWGGQELTPGRWDRNASWAFGEEFLASRGCLHGPRPGVSDKCVEVCPPPVQECACTQQGRQSRACWQGMGGRHWMGNGPRGR